MKFNSTMISTIAAQDHYALVSPQAFVQHMDNHWSERLQLVSSPALRDLWSTMASTFRQSIINSISGVIDAPWLILQPPTGAGKTEGACLFAALQAGANSTSTLRPIGVLIVTRLIEQADTIATKINEHAGRVVAVAHHSQNSVSPQGRQDSDVLIITHQAYVNASEHLGGHKDASYFSWRGGNRLLTIIDEALANVVEETRVTLADLTQVLSHITPEMRATFPEQVKVLTDLIFVLEKYSDPKGRSDDRATRMLWDTDKSAMSIMPDMALLRSAMKRLRYDTLVLQEIHDGNRERIAEKVDDTIRSSQVVTEQWAYYAQNGAEHSINSSSLLLPLDTPGPVVLDATASTNFMWNLFGPKAEIVPTPPKVRGYAAVTLHVARASGLGKGSMIPNARTRVPRLLDALKVEVSPDRSVFMCVHKDTKHVPLTYVNHFARFDVGHWGAIDGRNKWSDYDTAVIFGLPYRNRIWSTNFFFALRGHQDDYWFEEPEWNEHDDVGQVMEQCQLSVSVIQAINRVRCRRVIDAQGQSPSADIYIILPKGQLGDAILRDILADMPGIRELPWDFEMDGPAVAGVRRGSSHEALITYMTSRLPGETAMSAIKRELELSESALRKLKEVLRDEMHVLTTTLRNMGVRYFVRGRGPGAKGFLIKDQAA